VPQRSSIRADSAFLRLKVVVPGSTDRFGGDGNLYVTTYTAGELLRVEARMGKPGASQKLSGNRQLQFPDALRALGDKVSY